MKNRRAYPTDVSDAEWAEIALCLPEPRVGRPRKYPQRELLNAVLYLTRTGCSWRYLPHDFPPWQAVSAYFRRCHRLGRWVQINDRLREQVRHRLGREAEPSLIIVDSQSVKTTEKGAFAAWTGANG
jgi:transposase